MTVYIRDKLGAFNCQDVKNFSVCGNEVLVEYMGGDEARYQGAQVIGAEMEG